jgi:hypothetical protein
MARNVMLSWNADVCNFGEGLPVGPVIGQLHPDCTFFLYSCKVYFNTFSAMLAMLQYRYEIQ